jgi:hypothetical protein
MLVGLLVVPAAFAQGADQKIPAEVQNIVGKFTGTWTAFTVNASGEVVKSSGWTDTIIAEKPNVLKDRAFVETVDEMIFEGGRIPPQKVPGKEGYFINKDGSLGDYYIEFFGQTVPTKKLGSNVWVYTLPANPREFAALGDKFVSANHVLVKSTVVEAGQEVHNITRITDLKWRDAEGKERFTQFVSLKGQHRKVK